MVTMLTIAAVALAFWVAPRPAGAVILAGPTPRNTSPPTGSLANSGWQFQAQFAGFLGTPVSSKYFLTAQHIGGGVGGSVDYAGQTYFTDQFVDVPNTDLRLWRISGTFPTWAPMWNTSIDGNEVNRRFVVFGRGTQRGQPLYGPINGPVQPSLAPTGPQEITPDYNDHFPPGYEIKGYTWGPEDRVQSWGENTVKQVVNFGPDFGQYLYFTFDANGLANEAHLSAGDSGGGVFIRSPTTGQWKLAGINYGVDGPYRFQPESASFFAAMLDTSGLFAGEPPVLVSPEGMHKPNGGYVSRVSASRIFIESVINATALDATSAAVPEPSTAAILGVSAVWALRARRRTTTPDVPTARCGAPS